MSLVVLMWWVSLLSYFVVFFTFSGIPIFWVYQILLVSCHNKFCAFYWRLKIWSYKEQNLTLVHLWILTHLINAYRLLWNGNPYRETIEHFWLVLTLGVFGHENWEELKRDVKIWVLFCVAMWSCFWIFVNILKWKTTFWCSSGILQSKHVFQSWLYSAKSKVSLTNSPLSSIAAVN